MKNQKVIIWAAETGVPSEAPGEDERIRKFLVKHVSEWIGCIEHDLKISSKDVESEEELAMFKAGLAWLEKQKEPHFTKRNALFDKCVANCDPGTMKRVSDKVDAMLQKEQKPVNVDYISGIREELLGIEDNAKNIDGLTESQWVAIRAAHRLLGEYIEKEQKPVEWSEEKEKIVNNYADEIIKWEDAHKDWDRQVIRATAYHFFNFQPKQEWSDEEEKMLNRIIETLSLPPIYDTKACAKMVSWLKSLRPQLSDEEIKKIRSEEYTKGFNDAAFGGQLKEWSAEDEDRIRQIERIAQQAGCTQKLQEEIHDWLKSLRPSWKPSKEQMEALESAVKLYKDTHFEIHHEKIVSLYEQLKKLM